MVPGQLEVTHDLDGDEVAVVQRGRGRVEADIEGERPVVESCVQLVEVGVLGDEAPPLQLVQDIGHDRVAFPWWALRDPLSRGRCPVHRRRKSATSGPGSRPLSARGPAPGRGCTPMLGP